MSLVNDMLRDLDQRRRDAEGTSLRVKLTPAADFPRSRGSRRLLLVVVVLLVVAAGLGFVWLQQANTDSPRTLDIRPAVVSAGIDEESGGAATPPLVEAAATATGGASGQAPGRTEPQSQTAADAGAGAPESDSGGGPPAGTERETANVVAAEPDSAARTENEAAGTENDAPEPEGAAATTQNETNELATAGESEAAGTAEPVAGSGAREAATAAPTRDSGLTPPAATPNVKDLGDMSPPMRDTLAVQEALRLIADNRIIDAYTHLEQHILANRYAHQSRETYAKLLLNEGELLAAGQLVESGLQLAPNHSGYKKVKARLLIADGRMREAAELLAGRAPAVGDDVEYHEILATAQLASRDYQGATNSYTGLVQQDRGQGKWWYGFAVSQESLGNTRAARQAYNRALQQGNLSPNLRRRSQDRLAALSE